MTARKKKSAPAGKQKKAVPAKAPAAPARPPRCFWLPVVGLTALAQLLVLGARTAEGRPPQLADIWPFLLWTTSTALLVLVLKVCRWRGSGALLSGLLLLGGLGVVVRARMSGTAEGVTDMHWLIQPLGIFWVAAGWLAVRRGRSGWLEAFWGLSALGLLAVAGGMLLMGTRFRGGLYAPGGMTPTEILKLFLPLALAGYFTRAEVWENRPPWRPPLLQALGLGLFWLVFCGLLVLHKDMGLVLLLSTTALCVLVGATRRSSWGILAVAGVAAGGWAVMNLLSHGARRFEAWLDPFSDPTGAGWQVLQGLSGLYAGGLLGIGFGAGRPDRLPIASSDFVYAVYAEEVGFVGALLLILLFAGIFRAGATITRRQTDRFASLLSLGLVASLAVQTLVNLGGVVTLLPITGVTLPLISQGGSSYWVTSLQFGLLLGLSDQER